MPVDDCRLAAPVIDRRREWLPGIEHEARGPVWLADAEDRRRTTVNLDGAALHEQAQTRSDRSGPCRGPRNTRCKRGGRYACE